MTERHVARKRFGQNFLVDQSIIARIVDRIAPKLGQTIVEIGPGQGALTEPLLASDANLVALEIDRDLGAELAVRYADVDNFSLHIGDVLKTDLKSIGLPDTFRVVGNLPYNISTPLLFHLLTYRSHIEDMVFMLQSEVVDRMVAEPGSKTYGRLSVMIQYHCEVSRLMTVPPSAFRPPPKVMSAIIRLAPKQLHASESDDLDVADRLDLVVRAAFSSRRKTLRNNLRDLVSDEQMEECGIDPGIRAERLELAQFVALAKTMPAVIQPSQTNTPKSGPSKNMDRRNRP